jgi:iron-sulfur cluster assembly accessory protein
LFISRLFEVDDAKVVVDKTSLDLVRGATIDYQQDLMRSSFSVVNNPQSESACGCGSSFAVKNFSISPAID